MYIAQRILAATQARPGGAGVTGPWESSPEARGVLAYINVVNPNGGVLNLQLDGKDPESGGAALLVQTNNFNTAGLKKVLIYPGGGVAGSAFDAVIAAVLPAEWRLRIAEDGTAKTYGAGYDILG